MAHDVSDAIWPTQAGTPMQFLGQVELAEDDVTRALLTWDVRLYLFWARTGDIDQFKLVEQDPGAQTLEEHYLSET